MPNKYGPKSNMDENTLQTIPNNQVDGKPLKAKWKQSDKTKYSVYFRLLGCVYS